MKFEDRSRKLDLCALALVALVVFLGLALWSYTSADPPSSTVWPPSVSVQNSCGRAGAYAAHYLLENLGVGAYYLLISLVVLTFFLLVRREVDQPALRAVGWAISVFGLSTLAALAIPNWTAGPVVGAGGTLGAMGRGLLEAHFAQAGAYIFALSVLLAGLLLSTDYFLFRAAAVTTSVTGRSLLHVGHLGHAAKRKNIRPKSDLEADVELDEDEDESEEWEEGDEEESDEEEHDEDEADDEDTRECKVRTPGGNTSDEDDEDSTQEDAPDAAAEGTASKLANGLKAALGLANRKSPPPAKTPAKSEREVVIEQLEAADQQPIGHEGDYELPSLDLLLPNEEISYEEHEKEVRRKAKILEKTFKNFGFNVRVVEIETGPVIAQYEVELEAGLRLAKIANLSDDLAIALRVPSVRIVAPIPGKNTVGIEVPNENRQLVRLREVIEEANGRAKRMKIPLYLGKDVAGNPLLVDLASLPHLLIAGRTGTGKSVCLNSIIVSILMTRGPDEVRMLMIDPKMVELCGYGKLPHLMHPVVTDMRKAEAILAWAVDKMEERYQLLSRAGVRHLSVYNQLGDDELRDRIRPEGEEEWSLIPRQLPYIVIVADELADLMMTSGKDVEQHIIRLAQKSRAVGIHLILATQKPTVDVITGLIKSNLPARIAFQVASRTDSRVVLDEMGADKLLGNGDMLFLSPGTSQLLRGQGTYLSDDEITRVVDSIGVEAPQFAGELMQLKTKDELEAAASGGFKNRDELYETAVDIVVRERRGSCSLLQRALGIGYGRAARLIDFMAEDGIVGQYNGSQAREVQISIEDWEAMSRSASEESTPATAAAATVSAAATAGSPPQFVAKSATAVATALAPARPARRNKITPAIEEPSDLENEDLVAEDSEDQWDEESDAEPKLAEDEEELWDEEDDDDSADAESGEEESEEEEFEDEEEEAIDAAVEQSESDLNEEKPDEEWDEEVEESGEDDDSDEESNEDEEEWEEESETEKKSYHRAKR